VGITERKKIIENIEKLRGSKMMCYLTSMRPNLNAMISQDAVREFFEHLRLLSNRPEKKIDIFLCSNGGDGTVPWRLATLFREYAESVAVLLPYRAYSAATMLALGANEIVMHPFAEMGPIDPTVTNEFNPHDPVTNQKLGISVEDVKAYVSFIKETVGIRHEDELIKAISILAEKVHPLAIGNVERFISQSRMIARKLLSIHMDETTHKHHIDEIVDILASKLYFHGHPINRKEAKELGLKVNIQNSPELESAMWDLYTDFEEDLKNTEPYDPIAALLAHIDATGAAGSATPTSVPGTTVAPAPTAAPEITLNATFAIIEGTRLHSSYNARRRYRVAGYGPMGDPLVRQEQLQQGWSRQFTP